MAGYTKDRETNYEIKYLRKVIGQVDKRIQVPESVSADSLRHLLDTVETPSVREIAPRRPFRLTLQSGIAYAAAFALVVALFYSTRLYRPDIISGGMDISTAAQQQPIPAAHAEAAGAAMDDGEVQTPLVAAETVDAPVIDPISLNDGDTAETGGDAEAVHLFGVGGSGKANLVVEQGGYAFYWRENDLSDPDRTSPISFEVVDTVTQETVTQTDVPLLAVAKSFELDGNIIFAGNNLDGNAAIYSYDISASDGTFVADKFAQGGKLIDANIYKAIVYIVSLSDTGETDAYSELLPNAISSETCVITAFDPKTKETVIKRFVGANGTIQLDDSIAYIQYTGQDENGEDKDYTAQIFFDGMEITLV